MQIEKVTFYKQNPQFSKTGEVGNSTTLNCISLPRVKFLEADGPYKPVWAVEPRKDDIIFLRSDTVKGFKADIRIASRNKSPITELEQTVSDLHRSGMTFDAMVEKIKKPKSTLVACFNRYKIKIKLMESEG